MKISVLLNNVTQEQAGTSDNDVAFAGWLHMPGAGPDGGNLLQRDEVGSRFGTRTLPRLSARREAWGGVVVHGPTMMVFQVDDEAYEIIERLISGTSLDEALHDASAPPQEVEDFRQFVEAHDLV